MTHKLLSVKLLFCLPFLLSEGHQVRHNIYINVISTVLREYQHSSHRYAQSNNVLFKERLMFPGCNELFGRS